MVQSENSENHKEAVDQLKANFVSLPNKDQAWQDLHSLTQDDDSDVRWRAADVVGSAFRSIPDAHKDQAWWDMIRLTQDDDSSVRRHAAYAVGSAFISIPDAHKDQAWQDMIRLTQDDNSDVRGGAAYALGSAFRSIPDASKDQTWQDLHRLTQDDDGDVRMGVASALGSVFISIPDGSKDQAWHDLHRLIQDDDSFVRWRAVDAVGSAFISIPDAHKDQAWWDLISLTQDYNSFVRRSAAYALGSVFISIPDASKDQAWHDLHRLMQDDNRDVRWGAAYALGFAFISIPDAHKDQAWHDLHRLTQDDDRRVRASANYSLGRVSILKATEAENENEFKSELKNTLEFFEKSNAEATFDNPARFCHPFYKSIFSITFEERNVEAEVQEYIKEAKNAVAGSESKKTLLEAVENLENALREVHKSREKGLGAWKHDLKTYKRYCDRACDLLEITEKDAPGATMIIRKGLPIIDQQIKKMIGEIQEKAKVLCKQTRETLFEDLGKEVNQISQDLSFIRDPITLEKNINNLLIALSPICDKVSEKDTEACRFYEIAKQESYIEDKLPLMSMILVKFTSQISDKKVMGGPGITAGRDVIFGNVSGQVGIGEHIEQIQTIEQTDLEELRKSLLTFQELVAHLGLYSDYQNVVNGDISAAVIEAKKDKPAISKVKERFESVLNTIREAGKTIQETSELYDPVKKIAKLIGVSLSLLP